MISKVSFGSTFKVTATKDPEQLRAFNDFCKLCKGIRQSKNCDGFYKITEQPAIPPKTDKVIKQGDLRIKSIGHPWKTTATLVVDDSHDEDIDDICHFYKIDYTQSSEKDSKPAAINKRIEKPICGYQKVYINAEKFEKLMTGKNSEFEKDAENYKGENKLETNFMLKSGEKFPTTTIFFDCPDNMSVGRLKDNIRQNGLTRSILDKINCDTQKMTDSPDNFAYHAFRDMGVKNIPVYMDNTSVQTANAIGLLEFGLK